MEIIIIAAVSQNGVIGNQGCIPWHNREELMHFKNTTMGSPIIMGRKTYESMKKPLKGRLNIVVTKTDNYRKSVPEEVIVSNTLENALEICRNKNAEKVFIIGGGEIYKQSINLSNSLLISFMKFEIEGDTFFPAIDNKVWEKSSEDDHDTFTVVKFIRKEKHEQQNTNIT